MTREHDALRDLIAPVALGAAEPDEVARVEAHAAECAVCREDTAVVSLSRLPQLDQGDAYQLRILREGQDPQSAGLFEETGPAQARTVATGLAGAEGLAVTAQPRTSRTTPQGPILVEAALRSG